MLWQRRLCWRAREFESLLRSGRFWGVWMFVPSEHPVHTVKEWMYSVLVVLQ